MKTWRLSDRLRAFFTKDSASFEQFLEELEDTLIEGDIGPRLATEISAKLRVFGQGEGLKTLPELKKALATILIQGLKPINQALDTNRLNIILLLGVNGVGKTTTVAKLAAWYRATTGLEPLLAACDTFRAAAAEQLKIHADRLGLQIVAHKGGGDPAAVLYDAIEAAKARQLRLIIADSAGRMHTKTSLVEELKKIDRVVNSKSAEAIYRKYLVVDATTGRNASAQAAIFHEAVQLDGAILTKMDSTAKGGAVFALAAELDIATAFIGNGENYTDLAPFEIEPYVNEFIGLD